MSFSLLALSRYLLLFSILFSNSLVFAQKEYVQQVQAEAGRLQLFSHDAWHALLHYKPAGSTYKSQADDRRFFNAKDGHVSPKNELFATLDVLLTESDKEKHAQCLFPARFHWLDQRLHFDRSKITIHSCEGLEQWRGELKPYSLDLIFPAAFLNGPSSMFGHTLLRINSHDYRKDLPLVGYALNYAANSDVTDNALFFSVKGLIGGYPGVFSIVPYYEKLNEYRDIENRDIWEYSLNLTKEEVEQLLRHTWELRHINFDYYYLTENCSYHMLSLMEVARPGLKLTPFFETKAIPADTVRRIIDAGLVKDIKYRPSTTTTIKHHAADMDVTANQLSIDLAKGIVDTDSEPMQQLSGRDKSRILEQAYDYSRYLFTETPSVRDVRAKQNWSLLAARSENMTSPDWSEIPTPTVSPDLSHDTARLALGVGEIGSLSYLALKFRPAFHDLVDPPQGYPGSSQINFLDLNLRYFEKPQKLRLDKLTVINVLSLAPKDIYFDPISWGVDIGLERIDAFNGKTNVAQITVDFGKSYSIGRSWIFSGLLEANVKAADRLNKNYSAGVGLRLNLLRQSAGYSTQVFAKTLAYRAGEENDYREFSLEQSYNFDTNLAMRVTANRIKSYVNYSTQVELSMHWYH